MKNKYTWFARIDVSDIVQNHLKSLSNANTTKSEFSDYLIFLIIPILVAVILPVLKIFLSDTIINIIITSLSIFVGLFFNVIVLIISTMCTKEDDPIKKQFLTEIIDNISYIIFISLVTIVTCIFASQNVDLIHQILNGICFFFLVHFFMTMLLVLKRIYKLFKHQMDSNNSVVQ
jgi:hypothetical protein